MEITGEPDVDSIGQDWQIPPGEETEPSSSTPAGAPLPRIVTGAELYTGEMVRLRPLLDGLIWDGLTMIVAKPKPGKSWLMPGAAVQVAVGPGIEGVAAHGRGPVLCSALAAPPARTIRPL